jgi:hypothetical protein
MKRALALAFALALLTGIAFFPPPALALSASIYQQALADNFPVSGTPITATLPGDALSTSDVLWSIIIIGSSGQTYTPTSGWALVTSATLTNSGQTALLYARNVVSADLSSPPSFSLSTGDASASSCVVWVLELENARVTLFGSSLTSAGTATTITSGSVTPTVAGSLGLALASGYTTNVITPPTSPWSTQQSGTNASGITWAGSSYSSMPTGSGITVTFTSATAQNLGLIYAVFAPPTCVSRIILVGVGC